MAKNTSYKVHVQRQTDAEIADVNIEQGAMMVSDTGLYMGYNGSNVKIYPATAPLSDLGWARIDDTVYTSSNKLTLSNGTEYTLPNNAGNVVHSNGDTYYDAVNQKLISSNANDVYILTVVFKAQTSNTQNCHLDLRMTGFGELDRIAKPIGYWKGNNTEQHVHEVMQYYTDADFVTNGAQLKITSDGRDSSIWGIIYFIQKTQSYV
jgi:hypothetical protein